MADEELATLRAEPLENLVQYHNVVRGELERFNQSLIALRHARQRYEEAKKVIHTLREIKGENSALVPLTSSLFAHASLGDIEKVLVSVGTGFYIERPLDRVLDFFDRKMEIIAENQTTILTLVKKKQALRDKIIAVAQKKQAAAATGGAAAGAQ